jgi:molybdenum cofactor cytidylyltransferase
MGAPKALLPYGDRSFLEHLLAVTGHPKVGVRRVVLGADAPAIAAGVTLERDEVVINEQWEKGQLTSIQAGLRSLPAGTDGMLLCLIDHPLVSRGLVHDLIELFYSSRKPVVLPLYQGRRGHPVIFASQLYEELLVAPLEMGARAVVWAHSEEISALVTNEEGCVLNLNDPSALTEARERVRPI